MRGGLEMKTLRFVLTITCLSFVLMTYGQDFSSFPLAEFQSTSAMKGSGSAYSSNPMINADGTASYRGASYKPAQASGVRKGPVKTDGDKDGPAFPIGDAVLPLMLMALGYGIWRVRKKSSTVKDPKIGE